MQGLKGLAGSKKGTLAALSSVAIPIVGMVSKQIGLDPEFVMTVVGSVFGIGIGGQAYVDRAKVGTWQDLGFKPPVIVDPGPGETPPKPNAGRAGLDLIGIVAVGFALLFYAGGCKAQNLATARVTAVTEAANGTYIPIIDLRTNGDAIVGFTAVDATIAVFDRNTGEPLVGPVLIESSEGVRVFSKSRNVNESFDIGAELPYWVFTEGFYRPGESGLLNRFTEPPIPPDAGIGWEPED